MKRFYFNHYHEIWCQNKEIAESRFKVIKMVLDRTKDIKVGTCSIHNLKDGESVVVVDCADPIWRAIMESLEIRRSFSYVYE